MGSFGRYYEDAAKKFADLVGGYCGKEPKCVVLAKCCPSKYSDYVDVVVGGMHCAGYDLRRVRKVGESGVFYADFLPSALGGFELLRVAFYVDDSDTCLFAGEKCDDVYSLLIYVSSICRLFADGEYDKFEMLGE